MKYEVQITSPDGKAHTMKVEQSADGAWLVNGALFVVDTTTPEPGLLSLISEKASYEIRRNPIIASDDAFSILLNGIEFTAAVHDPRSLRSRRGSAASTDGPRKLIAPMPGKVVRILAPEGTTVTAGQGVIVIEAMKMQNELKSPKDGVVKKISFIEGATVNPGDTLAVIE